MFHRISFILTFFLLLSGLAWWSNQVEVSGSVETVRPGETAQPRQGSHHRELLEVMDRIVSYEHYYRSVYGRFTKILSRVGYSIPQYVATSYDIRVSEATEDKLLLTALSEVDGKTGDLVSVNQDFQVHANFTLPVPRPEFLKLKAMRHIRTLMDAPAGQIPDEQGIFRGYFKYETRNDTRDRKNVFAVGIRHPVMGMQLEVDPNNSRDIAELDLSDEVLQGDEALLESTATGQQTAGTTMSTLEEAYLAQKIFRGEVGRYAKNWSELSQITHFRFPGKERLKENSALFAEIGPGSVQDVVSAVNSQARAETANQTELAPSERKISSMPRPIELELPEDTRGSAALEVEPISADEM